MHRRDYIGKKIYYQEDKLGEITDVRNDPFDGSRDIAVIETSKNDFKAAPLEFVDTVANRLEFQKDRRIFDDFPKLSNRDIEEERDKYTNALREHYGEPQNWNPNQKDEIDSKKDEAYMGSSQITDQEPDDNKTLGDKMDYDKVKRGEK